MTYKYTKNLMYTAFEILGLALGWDATLSCRLFLDPYFGTSLTRPKLWDLAPPLSGVILLWIISKAWLSAVRRKKYPHVGDGFALLFECISVVGTLTILMTFFSRQLGASLSRSFVLLFVPISLVALFLARYAALLIIVAIEKRWPGSERVAIVGAGEEALSIFDRVRHAEDAHMQVAGLILPEACEPDGVTLGAPILGTTRSLAAVINSARINRIIVARNCVSESEAGRCGVVAQRMSVVLSEAIATPASQLRVALADIPGMPLLEFSPAAFYQPYEFLKRCFDIVVSFLLLITLAPVMLATALGVLLTSQGPIFYKSARVGKGGRHFTFLKFRSMHDRPAGPLTFCPESRDGHIFKDKKDSRITPFGRIIRRYSIDELPQLFNVLLGDMSLVGPRPLPAADLDPDGQSQQFAHWSGQRSKVPPGITGLWQIRGRSDLLFQDMVRLDLEYIQSWSLGFDLRIIFETPIAVLTGHGAY